jgi:hypothetical protein
VTRRVSVRGPAAVLVVVLGLVCALGGCDRSRPAAAHRDLAGTLTVDGAPAELLRCRPGHDAHVFVEVDTSLGALRFGSGALSWNGAAVACNQLDRSWGGGVRKDGAAYFRGTLAFRCGGLVGDLILDCGQITPEEAAELSHNRTGAITPP